MTLTIRTHLDLTAADLMSPHLIAIPRRTSLREAAHLLREADVTGAPVVDEQGRCVGVLSAVDFLHWAEEGPGKEPHPIRTCPYQTEARLSSGREAAICTLAEGGCALQAKQPTTLGRCALVCLMPHDVLSDWQQVIEDAPVDEIGKYMTSDVVTVKPTALVADLARMMLDAHIHRVVVVDEDDRPIGVVSATDVLAAVAREEAGHGRPR